MEQTFPMPTNDSDDRTLVEAFGNVYVSQGYSVLDLKNAGFLCFEMSRFRYFGFCDDFGPMNASTVLDFVDALEKMLFTFPTKNIVCTSHEKGARNFTNIIFLLGCFLILKRNHAPERVWGRFSKIESPVLLQYRDATYSTPSFGLTLLDCWCGLDHGKRLGWIDQLHLGEYRHYDNSLNGDLHIVVPGRFIAFKGPKDLPNGREYHDRDGFRDFSPVYYVDIFRELNVTAVVRLNEPNYDEAAFVSAGIDHHDLEFEDCSSPPNSVVAAFMRIADSARGLVAVHCRAGLGRTGTLIALDMMRRSGFTARAAMGWLRIMRPGSVIGEQQHFLCEVEREVDRCLQEAPAALARLPPRQPTIAVSRARAGATSAAELARQVAEGMERRAASRIRAGR